MSRTVLNGEISVEPEEHAAASVSSSGACHDHGDQEKQGKTFFFEKKNQKTFAPGGFGAGIATAPRRKRFFFKKSSSCRSFR